ncbi:unnamed protein product [Ectocarpus sp. 12 AP-2014]
MRRRGLIQMDEDASIDACFDYFRRKELTVDIQWVKEQIYRTSCVPENCPATPSLPEIFSRLDREEGEVEGEVATTAVVFRFN